MPLRIGKKGGGGVSKAISGGAKSVTGGGGQNFTKYGHKKAQQAGNSLAREGQRGANSLGKDVAKSFKDPLGYGREKGGKISSGIKTAMGNDPARSKPGQAPGAPGTPAAGNNEFNPFPFDYAKRTPTLNDQGLLQDKYKLDVTKERAESPWLKQQFAKQADEERFAKDDAVKNAEMNRANAASGLAQTSGASAGSMERMQKNSSRDALLAQQRVGQQGIDTRHGLRIGDTERQIGADQYNLGNTFGQIDKTYGADKDVWGQMAAGYANEQLANAIGEQKPVGIDQTLMDARSRAFGGGGWANGLRNPAQAMQPGGAGAWGVPSGNPQTGAFGVPGWNNNGTPYYGGQDKRPY